MIRKIELLYFAAVLVGLLPTAGCDKYASPSPEEAAERQEAHRLVDQKERAAMLERMKAAAVVPDKNQEPIRMLQKRIDALDVQILDARSKGRDFRPLEKAQEALETEKNELQRR